MINQKKTKNTQRGITLISLVITIILLLILATVAIHAERNSRLTVSAVMKLGTINNKSSNERIFFRRSIVSF